MNNHTLGQPNPEKRAIKLRKGSNYSVNRILQEFSRTFKRNNGPEVLDKLITDRPDKFFTIWGQFLKIASDRGETGQHQHDATALLNAMQSGRLAEQLASAVKEAERKLDNMIITDAQIIPNDPIDTTNKNDGPVTGQISPDKPR
jgi:hypothetical protein